MNVAAGHATAANYFSNSFDPLRDQHPVWDWLGSALPGLGGTRRERSRGTRRVGDQYAAEHPAHPGVKLVRDCRRRPLVHVGAVAVDFSARLHILYRADLSFVALHPFRHGDVGDELFLYYFRSDYGDGLVQRGRKTF